ncbi:MAG: Rhs element Vgr protein, partial [Deltaproteobacteria bacterium]|nr:Rhs element Vgr protein [Deltaproteobacteria bacterium]
QTMSAITTAGGNKIHIEDKAGSERILLHSPNQNSFIRIGASNDPSVSSEYEGLNFFPELTKGIKEITGDSFNVMVGMKNEFLLGPITSIVAGLRVWFTAGALVDCCLGAKLEFQLPEAFTIKNGHVDVASYNWKSYAWWLRMYNVQKQFWGQTDRIVAQKNQAITDRMQHELEADHAVLENLRTEGQRVDTAEQNVQTNVETMTAIGNDLHTIANKMNDVSAKIGMAGVHMGQSGVHLHDSAEALSNAGVHIGNAGVHVEEASATILQI